MFELPFVVRDRAATMNALDGALGARLKERMQERTPFRALGFWDNGFRHFTNQRAADPRAGGLQGAAHPHADERAASAKA